MSLTLTSPGGPVVDGWIPFTQYLLPDGRQAHVETHRPPDIAALAQRFIDAGGKYECEMLSDYATISFTAAIEVDGEMQDVACEISENGPAVTAAIDTVVRKSVQHFNGRDEA